MAAVMNFVGAFLGQKVAQTVSEVIDVRPSGEPRAGHRARRAARRDQLEPDHLVLRPALVVLARADRRAGRCGPGRRRAVQWATIVDKVVIPMVLSPLVGFVLAFLVMLAIMWIFRRRNPHRVTRGFRLAQTVSAAALALGHGLQDAQKTMGVIFLALVVGGLRRTERPTAAVGDLSAAVGDLARHLLRWLADHAHPRPHGSSTSTRRAASPPSRSARRCSTRRRSSGTRRSPRRTSSPRRSWAPAPPSGCSAVRWGVARTSWSPGCSTFPAAGLVAALVYLVLKFVFQLP